MTISIPTVYEGDLPSENDPVTFDGRMAALMEYQVDVFGPELKAFSEEFNAQVVPIAEDLEKVANINLGAFAVPPITTVIGARYLDTSVMPNVERIWNGTSWVMGSSLASAATLLAGTALRGADTGHTGGPAFLVLTGNFAIGATEPTNPAFWAASQTVGGVTFTRVSSDVDPVTGNTRVTYDCVGNMTAATASFGYVSDASLTNGLSGENWTASAFVAVTGPAGGGGGAVQAGTGFRMFQFQTGGSPTSVFGNSVTGARALSTVSRVLGVNGTVRCGFQLVGAIGAPINVRVVMEGVQFEKAAARTSLQYVERTGSEARSLMAAAPLPIAAAGIGQWTRVGSASSGAPCTLPAGGTWAYWLIASNASSGALVLFASGVLAGGTNVYQNVGDVGNAFCWRIA